MGDTLTTSFYFSQALKRQGIPQRSEKYISVKEKFIYSKESLFMGPDFNRLYYSSFSDSELNTYLPETIKVKGITYRLFIYREDGMWCVEYRQSPAPSPSGRAGVGSKPFIIYREDLECNAKARAIIKIVQKGWYKIKSK